MTTAAPGQRQEHTHTHTLHTTFGLTCFLTHTLPLPGFNSRRHCHRRRIVVVATMMKVTTAEHLISYHRHHHHHPWPRQTTTTWMPPRPTWRHRHHHPATAWVTTRLPHPTCRRRHHRVRAQHPTGTTRFLAAQRPRRRLQALALRQCSRAHPWAHYQGAVRHRSDQRLLPLAQCTHRHRHRLQRTTPLTNPTVRPVMRVLRAWRTWPNRASQLINHVESGFQDSLHRLCPTLLLWKGQALLGATDKGRPR